MRVLQHQLFLHPNPAAVKPVEAPVIAVSEEKKVAETTSEKTGEAVGRGIRKGAKALNDLGKGIRKGLKKEEQKE